MLRSLLLAVFVLETLLASGLVAQENAAARARTIAPLIDDQAVAVARLDVARLNAGALVDQLARVLPADPQEIAATKNQLVAMSQRVERSGVQEIYAVVTLADLPKSFGYLVVPLGANEGTVQAGLFRELAPQWNAQRIGNLLVVALPGTLERLRAIKPSPRPELATAFDSAGDAAMQIVVALNADQRRVMEELLPRLPAEIGGGDAGELTRSLRWAALSIEAPPKLSLRLTIQASDAAAADKLSGLVNRALAHAVQSAPQNAIPSVVQIAKLVSPKVERDRLTVVLDEANQGIASLLDAMRPMLLSVRAARERAQSTNNLRQLALAMHNFHDTHKSFPAAATYDSAGKPLLSWRVHLLPYLEQDHLYKQFRLNEPWDSEHNRKLIEKMPESLRSPNSKAPAGRTTYLAPVGKDTIFEGREGTQMAKIVDGTSNTIMLVESDDDHAVIWTRPDDLEIDSDDPLKGLVKTGREPGAAIVALCDGSVRSLPHTISKKTLAALFTKGGGEVVDF